MADMLIIDDLEPPPPPAHNHAPAPKHNSQPHNDIHEIRPSMHQRLSSLSIHEIKPNHKVRRDSAMDRDNYAYYKIEKRGEDWTQALRRKLSVPQHELEKKAKKGKSSVFEEMRRMGQLRHSHLERLLADLNNDDPGDGRWEVVSIKSERVANRNLKKAECKSMEVLAARQQHSSPKPKKYRTGELVDLAVETKSKSDKKDKNKDKEDKKSKDRSRSPKRDSGVDDPFGETTLFDKLGAPMDDRGPLEVSHANLPAHIVPDRPIGAAAREGENKDSKKDKKDKKKGRSKSKDSRPDFEPINGDDIIDILAGNELDDDIDAVLGRSVLNALDDPPQAEPGRRSRSRRRSQGARARSGHREPVSFPPNYHTRQYMGDSPGSAYSSEESHYGYDHEERSSYTSQDTYHSLGRHGSHYEDERPRAYKQHHRGPSAARSRPPPNNYHHAHGGGAPVRVYEEPIRTRRYSRGGYYANAEPIPEARQIDNGDYAGPLVRRRRPTLDPEPRYRQQGRPQRYHDSRPISLHYPNELPERRVEQYQNDRIRDYELDRREQEIRERERYMDEADRRREREMDLEREHRYGRPESGMRYYDDRYRYRGGYERYDDWE
jgi:hypothetical protein